MCVGGYWWVTCYSTQVGFWQPFLGILQAVAFMCGHSDSVASHVLIYMYTTTVTENVCQWQLFHMANSNTQVWWLFTTPLVFTCVEKLKKAEQDCLTILSILGKFLRKKPLLTVYTVCVECVTTTNGPICHHYIVCSSMTCCAPVKWPDELFQFKLL